MSQDRATPHQDGHTPDPDRVTLYHAPNTRSSGVLLLLEELGAPHDLHLLDTRAGENREPAYLAVNPMGKVPAIRHGEAVVTEQGAIFLYLADLFPRAGLAPPLGDPLRGPYLRWMVYYGSCFEPAVVDKARGLEPGPQAMSPYGSFGAVLDTLTAQLRRGPYLLGTRFSAADVLWGSALSWTTQFRLVPETPEIAAYVARHAARPAVGRARARDGALAG
ncbi:Disulfide-bond oxidoreductase YfcG [Methylobacterium crusticola]|uniref:Disulfide-bond oxidoreductase YfcG n=1 Tax=Methylobacterium crusticola TaxID=1697972 RepID=A0ABQ4R327_9HYPH|nr:glutathione S-transferase N-terminal domain-containing protein [Methylobacterium crusticola]GJD51686.1 Disulfide-bond oxidoreductase YfcG [Methylobacterium crusticola]